MSLTELFIIAVGLSMVAFAVSVCKGLSVQRLKLGHALTCGVYFGGFQGLMPALGYLLGSQFQNVIVKVDHWIAFILLGRLLEEKGHLIPLMGTHFKEAGRGWFRLNMGTSGEQVNKILERLALCWT